MAAKRKRKLVYADLKTMPHNGDLRPDLQFPDPVNGEMIGGQVGALRMAMRVKHTVLVWARRQGKSRFRQFLIPNEATITPGEYYAAICLPGHGMAYKLAETFVRSWGGMVRNARYNDKDNDRWVELGPFAPPPKQPAPSWFTPRLKKRWERCQDGDVNTLCKVYFLGASHPHYELLQGWPHHFNRIDWDECAKVHPGAYGVVRPALRDIDAPECFSGTPLSTGIGNVQFERWWNIAGDKSRRSWFRMRIPDGTNPHVKAMTPEKMVGMTEDEIRETMYAEFLSGSGAVFGNLDRVFILPWIQRDDPSVAWVKDIRRAFAMPTMEWWIHRPLPQEDHVYGLSIDWARSPKGDYSACTVFSFTTGEQVALFRWRGENLPDQMEAVLAIQKHYGAKQLHSDENGMGETMSDLMRRRQAVGFVGHRFGRNKPDYVHRGRVLFQDADVSLIDCAEQRHEFKSFGAWEKDTLGSENQIKYCAPQGEHDDMVAAFLHLAPTLTIVGRQHVPKPTPPEPPLLDEEGRTTLKQWAGGAKLPFFREDATEQLSWRDVVLTDKLR